ncbi:MAG TPA: hypothetical protein ENJ82_02340 [Bacteroidetes bacterium]|nr:hypothetical protein [Bacteroidota bacterium]
MHYSTGKKVILGFFTLLPLFTILIFVIFFLRIYLQPIENTAFNQEPPIEFFITLAVCIGIVVLTSLGLLAYYSINVMSNPAVRKDMQLIWLLIFFLGGILGMIVYYIMYILGDPPTLKQTQQ